MAMGKPKEEMVWTKGRDQSAVARLDLDLNNNGRKGTIQLGNLSSCKSQGKRKFFQIREDWEGEKLGPIGDKRRRGGRGPSCQKIERSRGKGAPYVRSLLKKRGVERCIVGETKPGNDRPQTGGGKGKENCNQMRGGQPKGQRGVHQYQDLTGLSVGAVPPFDNLKGGGPDDVDAQRRLGAATAERKALGGKGAIEEPAWGMQTCVGHGREEMPDAEKKPSCLCMETRKNRRACVSRRDKESSASGVESTVPLCDHIRRVEQEHSRQKGIGEKTIQGQKRENFKCPREGRCT